MERGNALAVATAIQLLVATVAPAQEPAADATLRAVAAPDEASGRSFDIPVGEQVRLLLGGLRVEGRVSASDDLALTIVQGNGVSYRASREALDRVEVARRRPRLQGALRAGLIGAVVGGGVSASFLVGQRENADGSCTDAYGTPQICATRQQVGQDAALGFAFGALIGALWPGHHWQRVRIDRVRVSVSSAPGGGVAARASVRF
jgi:hypothetical protein